MTAQGLIGCLYSPCRVRFPLTIQYHQLQNMSTTYFSVVYTYLFTRSLVTELCSFTPNRVNRYFTPLCCVLTPFHSSPFIALSLSQFHSKRSHLPAASSSITLRLFRLRHSTHLPWLKLQLFLVDITMYLLLIFFIIAT